VKLLLTNGANVNVTIAFGDTPLDWAIRNKKEDVAAILRNHGGKTGEELKAIEK
jgi:ankyrin repeat protein